MINCGIYKIVNIVNNKCYIGSSIAIRKRLSDHKRRLRKGQHNNIHMQKAWNKYGETSFSFDILLYCSGNDLFFYEDRAIATFKVLDKVSGYNCMPARRTDLSGSNYVKFRQQIAETQRKIMQSPDARERISQANKGRILTKETRQRMSIARKGRKMSREFCLKMSEINKGRIPSQKTREIWSKQRKGRMAGAKHPCAKATEVNGKLYPTVTAAIKALGISKTTYYRRLRGKR
jgi:group I intron endonuclease